MASKHNVLTAAVKNAVLFSCLVCMAFSADVIEQTKDATKSETKTSESVDIETVVLGPLRLWHIIGLLIAFFLIIITIACCCIDCRIPRTKQEIEESYQKRKLHDKFGGDIVKYAKALNKDKTDGSDDRSRSEQTRRSQPSAQYATTSDETTLEIPLTTIQQGY